MSVYPMWAIFVLDVWYFTRHTIARLAIFIASMITYWLMKWINGSITTASVVVIEGDVTDTYEYLIIRYMCEHH